MTRLLLALALAALLSPAVAATADAATTSSGKNCPNRTSGDIKKGYTC